MSFLAVDVCAPSLSVCVTGQKYFKLAKHLKWGVVLFEDGKDFTPLYYDRVSRDLLEMQSNSIYEKQLLHDRRIVEASPYAARTTTALLLRHGNRHHNSRQREEEEEEAEEEENEEEEEEQSGRGGGKKNRGTGESKETGRERIITKKEKNQQEKTREGG